jgi:alpha-glucosidase
MLNFSRSLLRWRRHQGLLREGGMRFLDVPEPFLCVERFLGDEAVEAVFNLSDRSASLHLPRVLVPMSASPFLGARLDGDTLTLPPYGVFMGAPVDAAA